MKKLLSLIVAIASAGALAQDHSHHSKHNLVVFGAGPVFGSHIVYKSPHNYQVILELELGTEATATYLAARAANPDALFTLLLDPMDISAIESAALLTGKLFVAQGEEPRREIATGLRLERKDFKVVYLNEVPLSLEPDPVKD